MTQKSCNIIKFRVFAELILRFGLEMIIFLLFKKITRISIPFIIGRIVRGWLQNVRNAKETGRLSVERRENKFVIDLQVTAKVNCYS